jgi:hypothetical protein
MRYWMILRGLMLLWLLVLCTVSVPNGSPLQAVGESLTLPADLGLNVTDAQFGATPDDDTDDTAAIQAALNLNREDTNLDYYGRPKQLYFPPGTYLVSDTLEWIGCCVGLQGAGSGQTVIKLIDNAPGFGDANNPKPVILTPQGNMSFRQNIFNLTIDTGSGNPGAVALDYISNNWGAIRSVVLKSSDGQGAVGLDMTRQWPGPLLVRDLEVSGFAVGIDIAHSEYGPTFEDITLSGMSVAGIRNTDNSLAIRRLTTNLSVPAVLATGGGSSLILLDSTLSGGSAAYSAVESNGDVLVRSLTTSGYQSALKVNGAVVPGDTQSEYIADNVYTLGPTGKTTTLNLPIAELPSFHDDNLANWAKFTTPNSDSAGQNLTALNEALNSGASTVYFSGGASLWGGATTVPASVKRIIAFNHNINNYDGTSLILRIEQPSADPLIIEGFGYGIRIEHKANRPLVLKHGGYQYTDFPGAGALYLDDVGLNIVTFKHTPNVWAWQLNTEGSGDTPRITNDGTKLWIFGIKTEGNSTVIETKNGGQTEVLGTLFYPATGVPDGRPALINNESDLSATMSFSSYVASGFFPVWVREIRYGITRDLSVDSVPGRTLPLYVGTRPALPPGELLVNGGFEDPGATSKQAAAWTISAVSGTGGSRKCNKTDKIIAQAGECALQIKAVPGGSSKVTQKIANPEVSAGVTLTLSAQVAGKSLNGARVQAKVLYDNGTKAKLRLADADLNAGTYAYKPLSAALPLANTVTQIKVQVSLKSGTGRLRIDAMSLNDGQSAQNPGITVPLPLP